MATSTKATATKKTAAKKPTAKKPAVKKAAGAKPVESKTTTPYVKAPAAAPNWYEIMAAALNQPGDLALTVKYMRQYSLSNRALAAMQLYARGLPMQPINTYNNWKKLNRIVQGGEKALAMIMPINVKFTKEEALAEGEDPKTVSFMRFTLRNNWFALSQTAGDEYVLPEAEGSEWNLKSAMTELQILEHPFEFLNPSDRRQGEAIRMSIAVSPLADDPQIARIREMARIMLKHTDPNASKAVPVDSWLRDLEAEAATYLCAASVGLTNLDHSRGIMQSALAASGEREMPAKNLHRAFSAADKIINAGYC